jgi:hypothetical protein
MSTPYKYIGEATPECAFLTSESEHDIAVIRRISNDPPTPNDDDWQRLIYLIDAAPQLFDVLKGVIAAFDEPHYGDLGKAQDTMFDAVESARIAVDRATGGRIK